MTITPTVSRPTELPTLLPADAAMVMSALEAGRHGGRSAIDRRTGHRRMLRAPAALHLYANVGGPPLVVYTRDVGGRNVGFIARHRLPLGYGGTIELPDLHGGPTPIACVLLRCTPAPGGWYDCCAAFNRLQPQFEA